MMKYRSKKTIVDDIQFDSKLEAKRYTELKLLQKSGKIKQLQLQPSFEIIPSFKKNGKTIRKSTYKADFQYIDTETGETIIEDVKGFKTELYKLKKKLFEYKYSNLTIKEVMK